MQRNKSRLHRKPNRRFNPRPKPAPFSPLFQLRSIFSTLFPQIQHCATNLFFLISFSEPSVGHVCAIFFSLLIFLWFVVFWLCLFLMFVFFVYLFADMMLLFHFVGIGLSLDTWSHICCYFSVLLLMWLRRWFLRGR